MHILERNEVFSCGGSGIFRHLSLYVVLLFFGAGHRKSYWNGCIKVAKVIRLQIFSDLALVISPVQFLFTQCFKIAFFGFGVEIWLWSCDFGRCCM